MKRDRSNNFQQKDREELKETKKCVQKKRNSLDPRRCDPLGKPREHAEAFTP